MQTSGVTLIMIRRCSLARTWMLANGSRSAYGLLYLAAVRGDWSEYEDRRHRLANTLSKSAGPCSPWVVAVCDLRGHGRECPSEPGRT
jgi:hypothetical protein